MLAILLALTLHRAPSEPSSGGYLYRATLLQAAPGRLLDVLGMVKSGWPAVREGGDEPPIAMRHSQGDRWDLMLLFPMGSWREYDAPDRLARREKARAAAAADLSRLAGATAWTEDVFVYGPPLAEVRAALGAAGFFHVEMFETLPGRRADLVRQREMENDYSRRLGLPQNLIFARDCGAPWDVFTVGGYRDLKQYAEGSDVPEAKADEAARAAGFDGAKAIGPYLRTLIALHHDTLAVAVR
ncbi:MAG: hypothetical protein ACM3NW_12900 [Syntrophomonadaceae bacterium]